MSRVLIQHYLNDLATLRQVSGTVIDLPGVSGQTQAIVEAMLEVPR